MMRRTFTTLAALAALTLTGAAGPIRLRPGQRWSIDLEVTSDAATPVVVEVHLVGPWHTWELLDRAAATVELPARGRSRIGLPVRVPAGWRPGKWWALVSYAHAGKLGYTAPIEIEVLP
jgi:hypothetical protein